MENNNCESMTENQIAKIGIIGGGAAGLAAAIVSGKVLRAAEECSGLQIDLIEKNSECGKKLLATGNGRCNITNTNAEDYQVSESFFNDLGILLSSEDEGRMYPYSKQAKTVRDILVDAARQYGINICTNLQIKSIEERGGIFVLKDSEGCIYEYDKIIITTGGKAGIQYGSEGDGLKFARNFGIDVTPVLPALVAMTYGENSKFNLKALKGVRANVNLTLKIGGESVATEKGEIQFTDYGLSGICIFNLSRHLKNAPRVNNELAECKVKIDFVPELNEKSLVSLFKNRLPAGLKGIVNEKIERVFLDGGLDPNTQAEKTAKALKAFSVNINGTKGWKEAQVTTGGVNPLRVDPVSMESLDVDNLFFAGEILDYDGPCGGYNLNWAWSTGIKAGLGAINGIHIDGDND